MCDCCQKHDINTLTRNGNENTYQCRLYSSYGSENTPLNLCRLHSIELFKLGESRFVSMYGDIRKAWRPESVLGSGSVTPKNIELVIG